MTTQLFPAQLSNLRDIIQFISLFGESISLPENILNHVLLAAEEAVVNIIKYAYPHQSDATLQITCSKTSEKLGIKLIITDKGIPFDPIQHVPQSPPSKAIIENHASHTLGGYGLWILIKLMDKVEYQRVNDENVLSLVKYAS